MLKVVENYFAAELGKHLKEDIAVSEGPSVPTQDGKSPDASVLICADRLTLATASEDLSDERSAARMFTLSTWPGDGQTSVFPLPPGDTDVAEVEAPAGSPLRRDDDYIVDERELRLLRAPVHEVRALLLGPPARGFVERRPAQMSLVLSVRASENLDQTVEHALAAAYRACVDMPALEGLLHDGVRVRLCRPVATLTGISYGDAAADRSHCDIEFVVRGELEVTVTAGERQAVDLIEGVDRHVSLIS